MPVHTDWPRGRDIIGPRAALSPYAPPLFKPACMKFVNALMTVIGWIFAIAAVLSMLGLGTVHLHFGPLDLRFPFHLRW